LNPENIIELKEITKLFPGVIALNHVNFSIKKGSVHGIVGENGAGKSTIMDILAGTKPPTKGELFVDGEKVVFNSRSDAMKKGVGIVFQELSLVPSISIAENIYANRQPLTKAGLINWKKLWADAAVEMDMFGLKIDPRQRVELLSAANQQMVEILKAISINPRILILDEPTSSLTEIEVNILFKNIRRLKANGCTVIYISHQLREVFTICDVVSVFKDGRHVVDANVKDIDEKFLVRNMVGRDIVDMYGKRDPKELDEIVKREPILCVKNISRAGEYYDVSFNVRPGEIVTLSGLVGAGRTEVCRGIFGLEPIDKGRIIFEDKDLSIKSSSSAIKHGIGYMTEDRKNEGLFLNNSIVFNIISNKIDKITKFGIMNEKKIMPQIENSIKRYRVACTGLDQVVNTLSGGNQQKVLFAEWIGNAPKVLIVDEPTRGIDVGAKNEIYMLLRELAAKGLAIVMVSSDLIEVLNMADRVIIMHKGTVVGELWGSEATEESVISLASGISAGVE
jgi:ABC-type sugar transport system ATPase subunit